MHHASIVKDKIKLSYITFTDTRELIPNVAYTDFSGQMPCGCGPCARTHVGDR